jgi:hypothetical protein
MFCEGYRRYERGYSRVTRSGPRSSLNSSLECPMPHPHDEDRRARLSALPAATLADALMKLAFHDETADNLVDRLIAPPADRLKRVRSALAGLRRGRKFVSWRESGEFARGLVAILEELRDSDCDPETGLDLVTRFYESDAAVLGRCDDSSGIIGDAFRTDARELWDHFAARSSEPEALVDRIEKLLSTDDYGVRDSVLRNVTQWLPPAQMRALVDRFWARAEAEAEAARGEEGHRSRPHAFLLVQILAERMVDPELYERATERWCGGKVGGLGLSIARVYLAAGRAVDAKRWVDRTEVGRHVFAREREELLEQVHEQLGEHDALVDLVRGRFERRPDVATLDRLVALLGEDQRAPLVVRAVERITSGESSLGSLDFLIETGHVDQAARIVCARRAEIDGSYYPHVLRLADLLEAAGFSLATSVLYRALLDSILERANTKTYGHGARYWHKLDTLAAAITEWQDIEPHASYRQRVQEKNKRKASFWAQVEKRE